jgi:hypothetical protein
MREELMANRMRYLQTLVRSLRAEVSTRELLFNPRLLWIICSMEFQLKQMERAYVGTPRTKAAV